MNKKRITRKMLLEERSRKIFSEEGENVQPEPNVDVPEPSQSNPGQDEVVDLPNGTKYKAREFRSNAKHCDGFTITPKIRQSTFDEATKKTKGQSAAIADDIMNSLTPDGWYVDFTGGTTVNIQSFEDYVNGTDLFSSENDAIESAKKMIAAWEKFLKTYLR